MKVLFKEKGKKKSSPFRQNGTERLRDRLTGPHAAHLPGCQEFRFTLGGTSPSAAISREGQTAFADQANEEQPSARSVSLRYDVCVCQSRRPFLVFVPIPSLKSSLYITDCKSGPVNILPLGCTQSEGMHLNGRS